MKCYRVACNEVQHGWISIEAKDEEDALVQAEEYLDEYGMDTSFNVFDREFDAVMAEEIG